MKVPLLAASLVATLLLCGCSSTKFSKYQGTDVFQGKGGAVRIVDGIAIWEDGDPDRKYKILGTITESHGSRLPFGRLSRLVPSSGEKDPDDRDAAIAKIAHKQGGDAVIILNGNQDSSGGGDSGHGGHRQSRKTVVVKYVE